MNQLSLHGLNQALNAGPAVLSMLLSVAVCSVRFLAAFAVLPATADAALPTLVRNMLCLVLGGFLAWGLPPGALQGLPASTLVGLVLKEALLGLVIGQVVSVVFWVAEGAGALIDNLAGFNNVQQVNPLSNEHSTPLGNLLQQLAITGFYLLGGMTALVGLVYESHGWWPLTEGLPSWGPWVERLATTTLGQYADLMTRLAAPVLLALVMVELAFGLLARSTPKLEPHQLALPAKALTATFMVALLVPLFFDQARPMLALQGVAARLAQWAAAY